MRLRQLLEVNEPILYVLEALPAMIEGREYVKGDKSIILPPGTRVQKMEEKDGRTYAWRMMEYGHNFINFKTAGAFSSETGEYNKKVGTKQEWDKKFLNDLRESTRTLTRGEEFRVVNPLRIISAANKPLILGPSTYHFDFIFLNEEDGVVLFKISAKSIPLTAKSEDFWPNIKTMKELDQEFLRGLKSED